jgi:plasmid stability protein
MISSLTIGDIIGTRMAQLLVRNLDDKVKERLRKRARDHGRSMEEEARVILSEAVPAPAKRPRKKGWASEIAEQFRGIGFTREEADALELRGYTLQPPDFK